MLVPRIMFHRRLETSSTSLRTSDLVWIELAKDYLHGGVYGINGVSYQKVNQPVLESFGDLSKCSL